MIRYPYPRKEASGCPTPLLIFLRCWRAPPQLNPLPQVAPILGEMVPAPRLSCRSVHFCGMGLDFSFFPLYRPISESRFFWSKQKDVPSIMEPLLDLRYPMSRCDPSPKYDRPSVPPLPSVSGSIMRKQFLIPPFSFFPNRSFFFSPIALSSAGRHSFFSRFLPVLSCLLQKPGDRRASFGLFPRCPADILRALVPLC